MKTNLPLLAPGSPPARRGTGILPVSTRPARPCHHSRRRLLALAVACSITALSACHSLGPGTVSRDRSEYSASIGESWKRQTLLNIVKLRYLDPPIFVDVGQIVAGYTLETSVSVNSGLVEAGPGTLNLGGAGRYTDRPTVTYSPLTGNKFIKSLMTPLPPESVFFLIESGWPADAVLMATTASINGLRNQQSTLTGSVPPTPEFLETLALMRRIQLAGGVAMRIQQDAQKQQTTLLSFRRPDIDPATLDDSIRLRRLLRLDPDATEFKLVFGATAANDREVAVLTRSIINLMQVVAALVNVPPQDLADGRAVPGWESMPSPGANPGAGLPGVRPIEIHSSKDKPADAFVVISYRDHWFWIDDRDLRSKRTFALMMMLFTLADTGEKEPLPLVTIPAQ